MRGRKPIPTDIKKLKGTAREGRLLKNEMPVVKIDGLPPAPDWLDEIGKAEWRIIVESLDRVNVLAKTDLALVAIYCNEVSVYIESEKILRSRTRAHLIKDNDGAVIGSRVVAYQRIANDSLKKLLSLAAEFGFTPSARTRIGIEKGDKKNATSDLFKIAK